MNEDRLYDEQGMEWTVYGIEALDTAGNILCCFSDIFFEQEKAKEFVQMCNEQAVEPVHIQDVIDDVLAQLYSV
ncbi:MAG: hypothetical protein IJ518_00915 [Clostridia bacterium]|nr:hypothetical protein [Clostridia bacterium]